MVLARELMWLMSAATPGVAAISYRDSSLTKGEICGGANTGVCQLQGINGVRPGKGAGSRQTA